MRISLWGTRGSLPNAGPETVRYGGNTACVEVRGKAGSLLVLDAGTGIRRMGAHLGPGGVLNARLHTGPILPPRLWST